MQVTHYTDKPQPYLLEKLPSGALQITIAANPRQEVHDTQEEGNGDSETQQATTWIADTSTFNISPGELDLNDVEAHPENYLDYATIQDKQAAKKAIQKWKNTQIENKLRIPTALGWDVEYSLDALIDSMGVFLMRLAQQPIDLTSWADADGEEHTGLSEADITAVALAIAMYRLEIQKKKNTAHKAVASAHTNAEITEILNNLYN